MHVPFVDLNAQYSCIKKDIDSTIASVIADSAFIGGQRLSDFENEFARIQGAKNCIAVANGTDAIYIVLKMLGIGSGDEVITVANSWISTPESISQVGAKPVFVDIDEYFNINVDLIPEKINERTKAILPVHLYGQPADLEEIVPLCHRHDLHLIEDCAQAHLARSGDTMVGNFGRAGTFSFYPGKNLGAYGDAGAIVTNDDRFAEKCRAYANHGSLTKHEHKMEGINSRLDGIQAAVLSVKLKSLANWTECRQRIAATYSKLLSGIAELTTPEIGRNRSHVFHLYVVRTRKRDALREFLAENDVQTGIHYPSALPFLPAYGYLEHTDDQFPAARICQDEILSLPIYPEITDEQIAHVVASIRNFFDQ